MSFIDLYNLLDIRLSGTVNEVNAQGDKGPPRKGKPFLGMCP
nr:MAG TPA: hypothetical protein [Caudoviricetes sp.]